MGKRFSAKKYRKLESSSRFKITPPDEILSLLNLNGDENIADLGCGTGVFTLKLAKAVTGKVYGIDISRALLNRARQKRNRANINYIQSPIEKIQQKIKVNLVFLSMVFHEVKREAIFKTIQNITAPSFKIAIVEWGKPKRKKTDLSSGPPYKDRISSQKLKEELKKHKFKLERFKELNKDAYFISAVWNKKDEI
ncbi:MAG: methyltransferase domain-containing protein [Elusimicrobia bacterium]|jgi:ubiquinone/menaquinone biosynthesis C-methylase UbiE|nr:methyltransferase domain-containing protein [Elusimicrobiota bacterium]